MSGHAWNRAAHRTGGAKWSCPNRTGAPAAAESPRAVTVAAPV